ncbi:3-deoxy-D-manno-octulosonic acid kinase [Marinomonas colpomeniae]|uniref:3-deoxy-D-manno-octulosonic acid kinase n=1 Tax=Marinomonas colpomeniae TaxID=2774408 RepID=A0ABR8P116_9GAMM|nr:3-deoxy-D-manno-octulosonic acid kinase [Marinomonas colpomeniae]MBD5771565.1 3-deoxy-D-manno-octulosonic acid kinase [Marinomonas colpomeniae]
MPQIINISPNAALLISDQTKPLTSSWFDPEFWRLQKAPIGTGKTLLGTGAGRGEVWFINSLFGQFVIRRYRRGGLVGKFNKSSFLFTGQEKTRPWLELSLLEHMNALGLPVPKPIAGSYSVNKGFYQATLLTETIEDAEDLFDIIKSIKRDQIPWQEIGKVVKRFHDNGIYHSDLNCHNIMIDSQNKIWVIDFDKCEQREPNSKWVQSNIDRLKRSLDKESKNHANFHVSSKQWQAFLEGYHG